MSARIARPEVYDAPKGGYPAVPDFTSDRMRMLGPLLTPRILFLARQRIITGEKFFYQDELQEIGTTTEELKVVLIVVLEINPREDLDSNEQGALRGITRVVYAKQSKRGELKR